MVRQPSENHAQARWILARRWVPQETLYAFLDALAAEAVLDLAGVLAERGHLNQNQAEEVRAAVRKKRARRSTVVHAAKKPAISGEAVIRKVMNQASAGSYEAAMPQQRSLGAALQAGQGKVSKRRATELQRSFENPSPGGSFRNYRILAEIGRGAMGVVFRATAPDGEDVALKFILENNPRPEDVQRFRLEAETLIRLQHRNIVEILDFGNEGGHFFLAMEYLNGQDFLERTKHHIQRKAKPLPWRETILHMIGIGRALQYCHERGITHRDVKPTNIFYDRDADRAVLVDFGLLKKQRNNSFDSSKAQLTKTGEMVGTPAFMAPEQFSPDPIDGEIGPKADVWGLAASVYYILCGQPPFNHPTVVEIYKAVLADQPRPVQLANPRVPDWLNDVLEDAFEKDHSLRMDMAEFCDRLQQGISGQSPETHRIRPTAGVKVAALVAGLMILVTGLALAFWPKASPATWSALSQPPTLTSSSQVSLTGAVSRGPVKVAINSMVIETDAKGQFQINVPVAEGENDITLSILNQEKPELKVFKVVKDSRAPVLRVDNSLVNENSGDPAYRLDDDWFLRGQVTDKHLERIELREGSSVLTQQTLSGAGYFELKLPKRTLDEVQASEFRAVSLYVFDQAKNQSSFACQVYAPRTVMRALREREETRLEELKRQQEAEAKSPSKQDSEPDEATQKALAEAREKRLAQGREQWLEGLNLSPEERAYVERLSSLAAWQQASSKQQQAVAKWLEGRLGPEFKFRRLRTFRCEGLSTPILVFLHSGLAADFHVIPGGAQFVRWWADAEMEFVVEYLRIFASGRFDENMLFGLLMNPPYAKMREYIGKLFKLGIVESAEDSQAKREKHTNTIMGYIRRNPGALKKLHRVFQNNLKHYSKTPHKDSFEYIPPFLMAQVESTVRTWKKHSEEIHEQLRGILKELKLRTNKPPDAMPISFLDITDVKSWLKKANESLTVKVRLPHRLEWTWACAGGSEQDFFWGQSPAMARRYAWHMSVKHRRALIRGAFDHSKSPNAFGLLDTIGNVEEWADPLWDLWNRNRPSLGSREKDRAAWKKVEGSYAVMGGSVAWVRGNSRRALFHFKKPADYFGVRGFRLAVSIPKKSQ